MQEIDFFEKLLYIGEAGHIIVAAPFVGRRSCAGQKKAAALIFQNRRPATVFFFPRRAGQVVDIYK